MKRFTTISSLVIVLSLFAAAQNKAAAQVSVQVSYQTFYDELEPYGYWIDYPEYGYVWRPDLGPGFRPYSTNGHWVWADGYGWTWVSNYSWGWAPFHYGRWFYDPYYGWLWVPGYEWSPAWVCWRTGGNYYGWAPLGPQFSVSLNFSFGRYSPPANYWCFVNRQYIASPRVYNYCAGVQQNTTLINNTTIINNYYRERNVFITGSPGRREVERYTTQPVRRVTVREASRPGRAEFRNNELAIYRPPVNRENRRFAPERVERFNRNQRNDITDNGYDRRRRFNNMGGSDANGPAGRRAEMMNRERNTGGAAQNRFEERRQQQQRMARQREADDHNARVFEQRRRQQERIIHQRDANDNNGRIFEQRRQQQEQMIRQRQQRPSQMERPNRSERFQRERGGFRGREAAPPQRSQQAQQGSDRGREPAGWRRNG